MKAMIVVRMGCLDDLTVANLVGNALPEAERSAALAHLDVCASCYEVVAAMAVGSPRAAEPARLAPGTEVDRYVIERVVGAGAMGVVYAARDPQLGRAVALKTVAGDAERMLREARAMAQLSHPNVIPIFDVGTHGEDVFLAMELLVGETLRTWLAEQRRTPRTILDVMREVGAGLAAAHGAGIVHRDIKPENILVGDHGRVCVTDFGLAQTSDAPADEVAGTPAYMSP